MICQETRAKIKKCGRRILADMQKIKASKDAAKQAAYDMQVYAYTCMYACVCVCVRARARAKDQSKEQLLLYMRRTWCQ